MKKRKLNLLFFFLYINIPVYAQKLPQIQKGNLYAPDNVSVDGKATEWKQLKARNSATDISYTLCNDENNLYLVVQATDHTIINKILGGGLTFSINTTNTKNIKNGISITYPVLDLDNRVWVNLKATPEIIPGSSSSVMAADTFMNNNNNRLIDKSKFIMITGMDGVDTLTSVYNQDGIRAVALFDRDMIYTYELSVNLKKLKLDINKPVKFAYNIRLNGVDEEAVWRKYGVIMTFNERGAVTSMSRVPGFKRTGGKVQVPSLPSKVHLPIFIMPTDFWGEYILTKKQ